MRTDSPFEAFWPGAAALLHAASGAPFSGQAAGMPTCRENPGSSRLSASLWSGLLWGVWSAILRIGVFWSRAVLALTDQLAQPVDGGPLAAGCVEVVPVLPAVARGLLQLASHLVN